MLRATLGAAPPRPSRLHLALRKRVLGSGPCRTLFPTPETGSRLCYTFSLRYEAKGWRIGPASQRVPPCASA